jgi:hypothetical protein
VTVLDFLDFDEADFDDLDPLDDFELPVFELLDFECFDLLDLEPELDESLCPELPDPEPDCSCAKTSSSCCLI